MTDRRAYLKVERRFFETDEFWLESRRYSKAEAWLDLNQMASWKERRFVVGLTAERLGRGEFMTSLRFLAERWSWGKDAVKGFLSLLENTRRLSRQRDRQAGTVYLLTGYDDSQSTPLGDPTADQTPEPTAARQQPDKTEASKQVSSKDLSDLTPTARAAELWSSLRGKPSYGRIGKALKELLPTHGAAQVLAVWAGYLDAQQGKTFCSPEDFVQNYLTYRQRFAVIYGEDGSERLMPDEPAAA